MRQFGQYAITARTLEPIGPMGSEGEAKIVGFAKLSLGNLGLKVTGVDHGGTLTLEDALALQENFIENASKRGVSVEGFEPAEAISRFG